MVSRLLLALATSCALSSGSGSSILGLGRLAASIVYPQRSMVSRLLLALATSCALSSGSGSSILGLGRLATPPPPLGAVRACAVDLNDKRFTILQNFLNEEDLSHVRADLDGRFSRGEMQQAGVRGRMSGNEGGKQSAVISSIRNAVTVWLNNLSPQTAVESNLLLFLDVFRMQLAEELRMDLSLEDTEVLYARYPAGGFYKAHSDSHSLGSPWGLRARDTERVLSFVLYVNELPWSSSDGGHLRMHGREVDQWQNSVDVPPIVGSLVLFLSQDFRHEVMETAVTRRAVVGWFRARSRGW